MKLLKEVREDGELISFIFMCLCCGLFFMAFIYSLIFYTIIVLTIVCILIGLIIAFFIGYIIIVIIVHYDYKRRARRGTKK